MSRAAAWGRELLLGARLAAAGGRASWSRTAMTAIGVGLGVALLLLAAATPTALDARDARTAARDDLQLSDAPTTRGPRTLLVADAAVRFRDEDVRGRLVQREGAAAPVPPGLARLPAAGEVVVSPRLRRLLDGPDGALLRPRIPGRIVGTITDAGLSGPGELAFWAGRGDLRVGPDGVRRIDRFGDTSQSEGQSPILALLVVVALVVLLVPVAVFVGAAVRFGGEERDRRLAALSLVGADRRMVRRIAGGEALLGALLGLATGTAFFLGARQLASGARVGDLSVFPTDLRPATALAALVAVAVPVTAVVITQLALGRVAIDPLGVVRRGGTRPRRLAWRLALPVLGLLLLVPLLRTDVAAGEHLDPWLAAAGIACVLVGITAVLPWVVETVVRRLRPGPVPWTLAVRRLQADGGAAARVVSGIAVAVAGAIALQTLFSAAEEVSTVRTGADVARYDAQVQTATGPGRPSAEQLRAALRRAGAEAALVREKALIERRDGTTSVVTVASCRVLRHLVVLRSCADGDAFVARGGPGIVVPAPGSAWRDGAARWRVPADARVVASRPSVIDGGPTEGVLLTPAAADRRALPGLSAAAAVRLGDGPDALEDLRNEAARLGPLTVVSALTATRADGEFLVVRRGIIAGAIAVLALIGASMLVSALQQLHERRRLLAALVAFGTPPRTIRRSVLLETAVPVGLGLALAVVAGTALGVVLLRLVGEPVRIDVGSTLLVVGVGAAVVPLVTALTGPALGRILRPEGLRTE